MNQRSDVLVWIDLEMTGLDPETCGIVEMAMLLTDAELNPLCDAFTAVIWQPESTLSAMSPFVRRMHQKSGLLDRIRAADLCVADVEQKALAILSKHAEFRSARLCGNSIWQDRRFLTKYMPSFETYLHYRQIDVSTLKELASMWYAEKYTKPTDGEHTALFDIEQSLAELKYLRQSVMKGREL